MHGMKDLICNKHIINDKATQNKGTLSSKYQLRKYLLLVSHDFRDNFANKVTKAYRSII